MGSQEERAYADFMGKIERTVYLDNLAPRVSLAVLRTALGQFGNVVNAQFIPNYVDSLDIPKCALVEMETVKQAKAVVDQMLTFPFMMSGMPRPVRVMPAEPEMFIDRPTKPGRKIICRWMDSLDPKFKAAQKLKEITRKHAAEVALLLKLQKEEEEKLAKQQQEALNAHYKKFDMIETIAQEGTLVKLGRQYKIKISED